MIFHQFTIHRIRQLFHKLSSCLHRSRFQSKRPSSRWVVILPLWLNRSNQILIWEQLRLLLLFLMICSVWDRIIWDLFFWNEYRNNLSFFPSNLLCSSDCIHFWDWVISVQNSCCLALALMKSSACCPSLCCSLRYI